MATKMNDILQELNIVLKERRHEDAQSSYVARLNQLGLDKILEKIAEESGEVIIAGKNFETTLDRSAVVGEIADLWFHCMVLLSHFDGNVVEVLDCLKERFGISGLEEKALRNNRDYKEGG